MKQNLVFVLCSLILAAGFVLGMGRYEVVFLEGTVLMARFDRWTGHTEKAKFYDGGLTYWEPIGEPFWKHDDWVPPEVKK